MPPKAAENAPVDNKKTWVLVAKIVFMPVILLAQAFRIYVLGCLGVYAARLGRGLLCGACVLCNCTFKDKAFPHDHTAIGAWKKMKPEEIDKAIQWRRISEVVAASSKTGAKLFSGKIEPGDICQGQLGDCWLMSACACIANQDGAVQQVFVTKEYNSYGKYVVKLYDTPNERWVRVAVDDWIPCNASTGQPMFAKPNGDEAWVLLLEKAMAKFKGDYSELDGGSTLWALECLTGDYCFKFKMDEKTSKWNRYDLVHQPKGNGQAGYNVMLGGTDDSLDGEEMFNALLFYNRKNSFIAASSGGGDDTQNVNGIVQGHAYAIINVKRVDRFQMVQLRNPWGTFEWSGDWSDKSPLWDQNPKVRRALDHSAADDGTFWMAWKDFYSYYKCVDFCIRAWDFSDIVLDVHEQHPYCGPTWGCIAGCAEYWLCCLGVRALFCASKQRTFEKPPPEGCCASCACV